MSFEFVIPLTRDDLLQKSSVKQYVVDEVFSIRNLNAKIKGIVNILRKGFLFFIQPIFEIYYLFFAL